ncbi:hypothetical protein FRACA_3960004 [Frankia canadensis]|uniref:Uncharacterized protein n=1 Tax=Frankia canadensis TaxID=1836972 RepID=A0A2I2KWA2_9ACTN|nr:hypothetical protein FRACA_3960004 [Frankia canadensis]SOU57247.1 hypothetical protein FRACA_3960004 [Frankia canadensis]
MLIIPGGIATGDLPLVGVTERRVLLIIPGGIATSVTGRGPTRWRQVADHPWRDRNPAVAPGHSRYGVADHPWRDRNRASRARSACMTPMS